MPNTEQDCLRRRLLLAQIARKDAQRSLVGNAEKAGDQIEKYLCLFRQAMNEHGNTDKYNDPKVGYDWCCAFVYYCCLEAGFNFPPKPAKELRCTLAAVPAWYDWATLPQNDFFISGFPEVGDIVIYSGLTRDVECDHIGIVVDVEQDAIITAEGNFENRTGIFRRPVKERIKGYVRLKGL